MSPAMLQASSFCVSAALSGAAARPGRQLASQGQSSRAVAQPLAASAVTEAAAPPAPVIVPPARPVDAPRRRGGRGGGSELVAWKSVRQERWEGALEVEGELPQWLVGDASDPTYYCTALSNMT
ncbi:hypothetical protein ABZP36_025447 [Zizania latifolia]